MSININLTFGKVTQRGEDVKMGEFSIMALLGFDENKSKQEIKNKKVSLSGSLSSYVRKQAIFTKPKPNTFGLIKTDEDGGEKIKEDQLNEKINENSF